LRAFNTGSMACSLTSSSESAYCAGSCQASPSTPAALGVLRPACAMAGAKSRHETRLSRRRNDGPPPFREDPLKRLRFGVAALADCQLALTVLTSAGRDAGGVPVGWQIKTNHGMPKISASQDEETACADMKSVDSSFALERSVNIDPAEMPYLMWRWKVSRPPIGGDFRRAATDDRAARFLRRAPGDGTSGTAIRRNNKCRAANCSSRAAASDGNRHGAPIPPLVDPPDTGCWRHEALPNETMTSAVWQTACTP
jgi:hypothetical protein